MTQLLRFGGGAAVAALTESTLALDP